jgi:hypothetical protein
MNSSNSLHHSTVPCIHIYSLQSHVLTFDHLRVQVIVISLILESSSALLCLSGLGELMVSNGF